VPPSLPPDALSRPELQRRIGPSAAARLTLITGPAGAGKTTLARAWVESLAQPWAWLTVDAALGQREQFWRAFVRALQLALPDVVLDAVDDVSGDTVDGTSVVQRVVDDLLGLQHDREPAILVIDEAHAIAAECWQDLAWLINHQPPGLHLVVVSRADPPFPIARLRALGVVSEVRQTDLAFRRNETDQLVRRRLADVPTGLVDTLQRRTEGWAAGIRLALLTLERDAPSPPTEILSRRDDAHGFVSELLISEALDQLPADVRRFLTEVCVVNVLEPALCDDLTGRSDSREVLRRLAHDHVFITSLDDRPDTYRFHPLFAEVLHGELQAVGAPAATTQHLRAARWYEASGRYPEAVEQALAGGHHDAAFELIVGHIGELYRDGHRQQVGRWLLDIPDSFICREPARAVEMCAGLLFVVRPEWLAWLPRARSIVDADRPDLLARLCLFEALSWAGRGDIDRFERAVARAGALRPAGHVDPFDEVIDAWRARLLVLHGNPAAALAVARDVNRRPRRLIQDAPALSLLGSVAASAGDPAASELVAAAISAWRSMGEPDLLGMADALITGAHLALRRGDVAEAEVLAVGAVAVSADRPVHLIGACAELALVAVERASGGAECADERLAALRRDLAAISRLHPAVLALVDAAERRHDDTRQGAPGRGSPLLEPLTERERLILHQLAGHRTYPEIGRELYISRHTVKTHVSRIYRKLGVSGRSAAVAAANAHGLLTR
jgi:LuxR family maltose regulon positive regulatory protein